MRLSPLSFRVHRWLGWLVGLQVLVWVVGGVVFAIVPFQSTVKSAALVRPPQVELPADWALRAAPALQAAAQRAPVVSLAAVATPQGPALRLGHRGGGAPSLVMADGSAWTPPDEAALRRFATGLYLGPPVAVTLQRLQHAPQRLGIVAETGGRSDLWLASFDDALRTRIYLDGRSGQFVTVRNEAWVWYDFFWRLHIMDYSGGEDFNGNLLRVAAISALVLVLSGSVLSVLALQRRWRQLRRPARH